MLVFLEGVPRSGKSYDAVATHILPAIAAGRKVFARLDGLDHARIADHLSLPVERVSELLELVDTADVVSLVAAEQEEGGRWRLPEKFVNSVVVIDEVHEFFASGRGKLDPKNANWFALHGHSGVDCVLLSQWYKLLHTAIRARVERKYVYQKLTALGAENRFVERVYQSVAPDKFERVDQRTRKYDPAIFPLYKGYVEDANAAVYSAGKTTVWRKLAPALVVFCGVLAVGLWFFLGFFSPESHSATKARSADSAGLGADVASSSVASPSPAATAPAPQHPPHVQYVLDLGKEARPRLAGYIRVPGGVDAGIVQWIADGDQVMDALTFDALRQLGWQVVVSGQLAVLTQAGEVVIVSGWPIERLHAVPQRVLDEQRSMAARASFASPSRQAAPLSHARGGSRVGANYVPPADLPGPRPSAW